MCTTIILIVLVISLVSIAEVERLWFRFQQLGCDENGEILEDDLQSLSIQDDAFSRNVGCVIFCFDNIWSALNCI